MPDGFIVEAMPVFNGTIQAVSKRRIRTPGSNWRYKKLPGVSCRYEPDPYAVVRNITVPSNRMKGISSKNKNNSQLPEVFRRLAISV
ncbi:hypothetical protein D3C72_2254490 [compost metagenome]